MLRAPAFTDTRLRIGLTGGIASGKSTVARLFADLGVPVIDLDLLAREVVQPGEPGLADLVEEFGAGILDDRGELDRAQLRTRVFNDSSARRRVEALLHPRILEATVRASETAGGPYQVLVAPLLVEFGLTEWVDRVLVVDCPTGTQVARLLARDAGDEALAHAILATQATHEQRLAAAHDVIVNDGAADRLPAAVATLDAVYQEMAADGDRAREGLRLP
jgi:dephospho-CoA kinase